MALDFEQAGVRAGWEAETGCWPCRAEPRRSAARPEQSLLPRGRGSAGREAGPAGVSSPPLYSALPCGRGRRRSSPLPCQAEAAAARFGVPFAALAAPPPVLLSSQWRRPEGGGGTAAITTPARLPFPGARSAPRSLRPSPAARDAATPAGWIML